MIGEEVYYLTAGNNCVIGTVSGTRDSWRSYDILTQGGTLLMRNRSHLKPRSHDIPMLNQYFFIRTSTPSQSEILHSGQHTLPKRNMQLTITIMIRKILFQDQHTLSKRNILSLDHHILPKRNILNLYQSFSSNTLEILSITLILQRHWFH